MISAAKIITQKKCEALLLRILYFSGRAIPIEYQSLQSDHFFQLAFPPLAESTLIV